MPAIHGLLEMVTAYTKNPDTFHAGINEHLRNTALPDAFKDLGTNDTQMALRLLAGALPPRLTSANPLASPSDRKMTTTETLKFQRTARGLLDPHAELQNPTPDGLAALKSVYPGTYQTFVGHLLSNVVGQNTAISSPTRRLLGAHGLDTSLREAGAIAQHIYSMPTQPPMGKQRQGPGKAGPSGSNAPQRVQTHNESVQEDAP